MSSGLDLKGLRVSTLGFAEMGLAMLTRWLKRRLGRSVNMRPSIVTKLSIVLAKQWKSIVSFSSVELS